MAMALSTGSGAAPAPVLPRLVAIAVDTAPQIDGKTNEDFWSRAPIVTVKTEGVGKWGAGNKSETTVRMQAAYTRDHIYIVVRWADPTFSLDYQRWAFDGTNWARDDMTPLERGGANTYYEDKLAFLWVMKSPSVEAKGDFRPTYVDEDDSEKAGYRRPVKSMPRAEKLDMWHWKLIRTGFTNPPQIDDQYVDETLSAQTAVNAGRKSDPSAPNTQSGYYDNTKQYTAPNGRTVNGPRYYVPGKTDVFIITQHMIDKGEVKEIASFQELMNFPAGTKIASQIGRPFTGSRGDITAAHNWMSGNYTLEIGRRLNTRDADTDILFTDLRKTYLFGVATFDNTQIKHAASDVIQLVFRR
jgi:hypothetical protein